MRRWLRGLASLQLTVTVLLVLLVALATGTIVEARRGAEAARAIYGSAGFTALLALFAVNLRPPWWCGGRAAPAVAAAGRLCDDPRRHGDGVAGALVTDLRKVQGQLARPEGDESDRFVTADGAAVALPFAVRLDAFEIDTYEGTRRPSMFRSRVRISDRLRGAPFPAVIEMNHESSPIAVFDSSRAVSPGGRAGDDGAVGLPRPRSTDRLRRLRPAARRHGDRARHPDRAAPGARRVPG